MAHLIPIKSLVGPRRWNKLSKIGFKTKAINSDDGFRIELYRTGVVAWSSRDARLLVNTDGWSTKITAERIRHGLEPLGLALLTSDLPGRWRVADLTTGEAWSLRYTLRGPSLRLQRDDQGNWHRVQPWQP